MAGKGGGAWKVAYADFVTAMMAFFLVMWIVAQDTKVKEQIEHYFVTPMGYAPIGERYQSKAGGAFESKSSGNMPLQESVAMGRGRAPPRGHRCGKPADQDDRRMAARSS